MIYSLWYRNSATVGKGTSGVGLPVQMPAEAVYAMVQSLQSGMLGLGHDTVERVLLQAHAMKVMQAEPQSLY